MAAVFLRELASYFRAITGFIFLGLFLLFAGLVFTLANLWPPGSSDLRATLTFLNFIFIIAVPILTMRLLSEEARQKTDQLLLTSPVSVTGIVLGKYLAALVLFAAALAVTGIYPALVDTVGLVIPSEVFCTYLGVFLLGSSLIAVGLFVSSLTDNPVSAAFLTFGVLLFIWVVDWVIQALPRDRAAGVALAAAAAAAAGGFVYATTKHRWVALATGAAGFAAAAAVYALKPAAYDGLLVRVFLWFSLVARYNDFSQGVIAAGPVTYYLTFTATMLFLTVRVIDRRRWA